MYKDVKENGLLWERLAEIPTAHLEKGYVA
jgi:hypothetical protein